jgi:hypothetical protein
MITRHKVLRSASWSPHAGVKPLQKTVNIGLEATAPRPGALPPASRLR